MKKKSFFMGTFTAIWHAVHSEDDWLAKRHHQSESLTAADGSRVITSPKKPSNESLGTIV
ncbi:hypothetical protein FD28_GL001226 [Levilactobacillus hammesii DSM 16381]|uniref:Uncharacterized protein n=1 Tax=Levilactobacillus hammesii DSM 16381 TaxID=1423753 RepID=A0A0R1UJB0_9LACO|nr:hypothetical protein FD28_GL001226 [Levilactobacillus hammesii DSM 16381]